jgi:hypothetical protein
VLEEQVTDHKLQSFASLLLFSLAFFSLNIIFYILIIVCLFECGCFLQELLILGKNLLAAIHILIFSHEIIACIEVTTLF